MPASSCDAAWAKSASIAPPSLLGLLGPAHQHADLVPAQAPLPQGRRALEHGHDAFRRLDRQHVVAHHHHAGASGERGKRRDGGKAGLDVGGVAPARAPAADHAANSGACRHLRPADAGLQAVDGTTGGVGGANGLVPVEDQHGAGLDHHAGQFGSRGLLDGARSDRRHVDAQLLARLGALRQHAAPPRQRTAVRQCRHPLQHGVGALCALDGQHRALRHHHGLAGVDDAQRLPHGKAQLRVGLILSSERNAAQAAGSGQQVGGHLVHAAHAEALGLEEAHDAREHGIVAPRQQAHDLRQAHEEAHVRPDAPQVRPLHATGNHQSIGAFRTQRRHHAADLAPVDPGVREAGDGRVGLALDGDDVHALPARHHALGNHQRQPTSACQNADAGHGRADGCGRE